jgi:hypothetical protein
MKALGCLLVIAILVIGSYCLLAGAMGGIGAVMGECTWDVKDGPDACSDYGVNGASLLTGGSGYNK